MKNYQLFGSIYNIVTTKYLVVEKLIDINICLFYQNFTRKGSVFLTLSELLSVTCCSVKIIPHCKREREIFIHSTYMEHSMITIIGLVKGLIPYLDDEVLAISTYSNGVESIMTITI